MPFGMFEEDYAPSRLVGSDAYDPLGAISQVNEVTDLLSFLLYRGDENVLEDASQGQMRGLANVLTIIHEVTAQALAVLDASQPPPLTGTALMKAGHAVAKTRA